MDKLPSLAICKAACAHVVQTEWHHVVIGTLEVQGVLSRIEAQQATVIDLAYCHGMIALSGFTAGRYSHVASTLQSISSEEVHNFHWSTARDLLLAVNSTFTAQEDVVLKTMANFLLCVYRFNRREMDAARQWLEISVEVAQASSWPLFPPDPTGTFTEAHITDEQRRMRADILVLDVYIAQVVRSTTVIANANRVEQEIKLLSNSIPTKSLEQQSAIQWQYSRLEGVQLAFDFNEMAANSPSSYSGSLDERRKFLIAAASLDRRLVEYMDSPHSSSSAMLSVARQEPISNIAAARAVHKASVQRSCAQLIRCRLVEVTGLSSAAMGVLASASLDILACLPYSLAILKSAWQPLAIVCPVRTYTDGAMSTLSRLLEQRLSKYSYSPISAHQKQQQQQTGFAFEATLIRHFDQYYDMLNQMDMLSPSAINCAYMLKHLPVKHAPSITSSFQGDMSKAFSNSASSSFSSSSSSSSSSSDIVKSSQQIREIAA